MRRPRCVGRSSPHPARECSTSGEFLLESGDVHAQVDKDAAGAGTLIQCEDQQQVRAGDARMPRRS